MSNVYSVPENFRQRALIDQADYERIYRESIETNEEFWANIAKRLDWIRFPTSIKDVSFDTINTVQYNTPYSLVETSYDPINKTCSTVPCHLNQPKPEWGKPYRWGWGSLECDQCHQYGDRKSVV